MTIFIIADDANGRGDLFNERMKDLVHALGYEVTRTNIHKPGREIDLIAEHPLEGHRAVVECKAKKEKIGGGEINKFVGALDAESDSDQKPAGYFASISGFTDSAIEQEASTGRRRVVLLGPKEIEHQLVRSRVLVVKSSAAFKAGTTPSLPRSWTAGDDCDLIAHTSGWLWIVYFSEGGERKAFTLIHADGDFPAPNIAKHVAEDLRLRSSITLPYIPGSPHPSSRDMIAAKSAYNDHISREYGSFTLEGFPVDQYSGTKSIGLEELYIPQSLEEIIDNEPVVTDPEADEPSHTPQKRLPLSSVLTENRAIAILGLPGSGKTTLIKRLATSYAAPNRRTMVTDSLPESDWIPLVLRCRDLPDANLPLVELLRDIPRRAEIPQFSAAFSELVDNALRDGTALILIDGIDEFPDARERARFLRRLRTFMSTYPLCTLIVTSREAGFRQVSGFVSERFKRYRIADLNNQEIRSLTLSWHVQAYGDTPQTQMRGALLASQIIGNDRVRRLAVNPLLLTTLLLVQRWVGDLPRKRSTLYEKAIELLLMTWNVEGFEPLDLDEAKPHLAFLAHAMTVEGKQQISQEEMLAVFMQARKALPEVLGYCKVSPRDLLSRIELRSSLVTQVGQVIHVGKLQPAYEFKHLTFQEYLTALALVSGWHGDATGEYDSLGLIESVIEEPHWSEIISLFGVLSGRKGSGVVAILCDRFEGVLGRYFDNDPDISDQERQGLDERNWQLRELLYQCLEDEVQVTPDLANRALELLIESPVDDSDGFPGIITSRYGDQLLEKAKEYVCDATDPRGSPYISVLGQALLTASSEACEEPSALSSRIADYLSSSSPEDHVAALSVLMSFAYSLATGATAGEYNIDDGQALEICQEHFDSIVHALHDGNVVVQFTALWAMAWSAQLLPMPVAQQQEIFPFLLATLVASPTGDLNSFAGWVISEAITELRSIEVPQLNRSAKEAIAEHLQSSDKWLSHLTRGAIVVSVLAGEKELIEPALEVLHRYRDSNKRFRDRIFAYLNRSGDR
ncbi:restriction endonuclease [Streptomyces neyagawaensis]|uniref:Restriction endonuclease n=1 Tax=Streptomyces neyagawaensis TaxID=42238 RepID=A0ABV3B312_9ACTN